MKALAVLGTLAAAALAPMTPAAPSAAGSPSAAPAAVAGTGEEGGAAAATSVILRSIGEARRAAGLPPVERHPVLEEIAAERAAELAAAGSIDSDAGTISRVSRRLFGRGYRAHRWVERTILGQRPSAGAAPAPELFERWSAGAGAAFVDSVLGPYSDIGIAAAEGPAGTIVVLLLAYPRRAEAERRAALLGEIETVRGAALAETNTARRRAGRAPLAADPLLDRAAQRHAEDMLERGFYDHRAPDGGTPRDRLRAVGYGPVRALSENIAKGLFTPEEVVERWLGSPGHRANLLDRRVTATGLGVAAGIDENDELQVLWVQLFARPREARR